MIVFIEGKIDELWPHKAVFAIGGLGRLVHIPLSTHTALEDVSHARLHTHHIIREDADLLFGFKTEEELDMFRDLLSVPNIGPSAALSCLSAHSVDELKSIIGNGQSDVLRKIKGIAEKASSQIIVSLQKKFKDAPAKELFSPINEEAVMGLVGLGYNKKDAEKAVAKVDPGLSVTDTIVRSLSMLSK
jgi:holliday junction DNA helicase RuvA